MRVADLLAFRGAPGAILDGFWVARSVPGRILEGLGAYFSYFLVRARVYRAQAPHVQKNMVFAGLPHGLTNSTFFSNTRFFLQTMRKIACKLLRIELLTSPEAFGDVNGLY